MDAELVEKFWNGIYWIAAKVWILQEVASEKCNSDKLNTFSSQKGTCYFLQNPYFYWTDLAVGVVLAFYFENNNKKIRQII